MKIGKLEVICGCMFSGKSEELIRRMRRAQIAKQHIQVFKPSIDTRYHEVEVTSHSGLNHEALPIDSASWILSLLKNATVVGIDEAQFFDDSIITVVQQLTQSGIRVIVSGLDRDFRGEPFGSMPHLMAIADHLDKLHAICMVCGEDATYTQRIIDGEPAYYDDPVILVGADEAYEARCRDCYSLPGGPKVELTARSSNGTYQPHLF